MYLLYIEPLTLASANNAVHLSIERSPTIDSFYQIRISSESRFLVIRSDIEPISISYSLSLRPGQIQISLKRSFINICLDT